MDRAVGAVPHVLVEPRDDRGGNVTRGSLNGLRFVPDHARSTTGAAGDAVQRSACKGRLLIEVLIDGAAPVADGAAVGAAVGHVGSLVAARRASLRRSVALLQSRHVGPDFHCIVFSGVRSWPFLQLGALIR